MNEKELVEFLDKMSDDTVTKVRLAAEREASDALNGLRRPDYRVMRAARIVEDRRDRIERRPAWAMSPTRPRHDAPAL